MAQTLYLENGSTEYIFAGETKADKLQQIIRENLGGTVKNCTRKSFPNQRAWMVRIMKGLLTATVVWLWTL